MNSISKPNNIRGEYLITVGEDTINIRLNMNAFAIMQREFGYSLSDFQNTTEEADDTGGDNSFKLMDIVNALVYSAVMNYYDRRGEDYPITRKGFDSVFADTWTNETMVTELLEAVTNSLGIEGAEVGNP
jgi:hypothetical protein